METNSILESRRSVNFFNPEKDIPESLVKRIINLAVNAPSAFNLQPWRLIVVKSAESKQKLYELSNKQPKILDAPLSVLIIADKYGWDKNNGMWGVMEKAIGNKSMIESFQHASAMLYGSSEENRIKFSFSNAGLLAMSVMYAATSLGVDSHPMSGFDVNKLHQAFNLKENEAFVMNIALGYFDERKQLYPRSYRKGYDEIVETL